MRARSNPFRAAVWLFLAYLLFVILFGAWVRISHSGDGCGSNWPTCRGEIVPTAPSAATLVEYTHRLTSGLCGVFCLALLGWSWQRQRAGPVTRALGWTLLFLVVEGAIGAGLVLGGLVGGDASAARAIVIALHLANTLALTAFAALAAHRSGSGPGGRFLARRRIAFAAGLAAMVAVSMSGAVTALGDTLFPRGLDLQPGLLAEVGPGAAPGTHFLVRLRILHPALAVAAAAYLLWLLLGEESGNRWARRALWLVIGQVVIGFFNIGLSAPGWMQLLHLLAAQSLWIALVLACAGLVASRRLPAS